MQPLSSKLVSSLDLSGSFDAEMVAPRNLIPPEPWRSVAATNKSRIVPYIAARLRAGARNSPNVAITARKGSRGSRPVPCMGLAERVIYRALATDALEPVEISDRTPEDYKAFVGGPIEYAFADAQPGLFRIDQARVSHVVEADISSFYEYVDHDLLRGELEVQSNARESIPFLLELLTETEGRTFGLPQLFDASDWLSDVYIRMVERDLKRRGLAVWRFNDDFRIASSTYAEALSAVERLEEAARHVGLTINDYKTFTPGLFNYVIKNTSLTVDNAAAAIDPQDVEVVLVEYVADEGEAVERAIETLRKIDDPDRIDLKNVSAADVRDLRRAIVGLLRAGSPEGLSYLTRLVQFIPSLTPRVVDYLIKVYAVQQSEVSELVLRLTNSSGLTDWQALWLAYAIRTLRLQVSNSDFTQWMKMQRQESKNSILRAEAALALADVKAISVQELDLGLRMEPEVLAPWYVMAISALDDQSSRGRELIRAVRQTSPLFSALVPET